jgi:hypothetical protein
MSTAPVRPVTVAGVLVGVTGSPQHITVLLARIAHVLP